MTRCLVCKKEFQIGDQIYHGMHEDCAFEEMDHLIEKREYSWKLKLAFIGIVIAVFLLWKFA